MAIDPSTTELAARLGVLAHEATVVRVTPISPVLTEVTLGGAGALAGAPGSDVMVRVGAPRGTVRRRYSVRGVDLAADELTLWVRHDHDGAGAQWARLAAAGDRVELVGPRGKITLDPIADWHLFVGDVSSLGAFYRLADAIEPPGRAIFVLELDHPDDVVTAPFDDGLGVTGIFVDRAERLASDPTGLLSALAAFALPPDLGHAYVFGEFHAVRAVRAALLDRGLAPEQISHKAFWRLGRVNQDHGEPEKGDD
jgi:NADPH-dependent ferric siderophore reductase